MIKKGIKRMSTSQFRSAKALIHNLCCNYDSATGNCLLLDDGEITKCPQLITLSVICNYLIKVLLEDRDGQLLKTQLYQADHVRRCEACGQPFQAISNRAKYCDKCSQKRRLQRQREYMASRRHKGG